MRFHLRSLGVRQHESFHPKLESQPSPPWNPKSQQALVVEFRLRRQHAHAVSVHHNVDHPVSLYGAIKKAHELLAHSYGHLFGLPTTGLRFFTGPSISFGSSVPFCFAVGR